MGETGDVLRGARLTAAPIAPLAREADRASLAHVRIPGRGWVARLLDAESVDRRGDPLVAGSTLPGFLVTRAVAPHELALEGRHRFAVYALVIRMDACDDGTMISAESRARFI